LLGLSRFGYSFYTPLLVLAVFYAPGVVLLSKLLGGLSGSVRTVFARDYSPLLTCSAMAWTAANLPLALAARVLPAAVLGYVTVAAYLYFAALMLLGVRSG